MAGIVGHVGRTNSERFVEALQLLRHDGRFVIEHYLDRERLQLAGVHRSDDTLRHTYEPTRRVGIAFYGSPYAPLTESPAQPTDVLEAYSAGGVAALLAFEGAFVIVVVDEDLGELIIVNDRLATHTVAYIADLGSFTFAPEAKAALYAASREPQLDTTGALEYLSLGYPVGQRTLFEGVARMPPASVLRVALADASFTETRSWDLTFREDRSLRRETEAVDALYNSLQAAVARATKALEGRYDLLLTGGYDSRILLALAAASGRRPQRAIAWGVDDAIPGSDPYIARRLAVQYGVPFAFMHYDHETFPTRAEPWTYISELGSDNLGNFAAGHGALTSDASLAPVVVNGDQLLGFGGIPVSFMDAFEVGTGLPYAGLAPGMRCLVRPERAIEARERTCATLMAMALPRSDGPHKDTQDYLAWHTTGVRWLGAPMYYREPMVSAWRPLVDRETIDLFARLPQLLRVDKRLLVRMLHHHLPTALDLPIASANSLVDWTIAFSSRTPTGAYFTEAVSDPSLLDTEVGAFIDADALRSAMTAFIQARHEPLDRTPGATQAVTGLRRSVARWHLTSVAARRVQRLLKRASGRAVGASLPRVLWRVMLLNVLLKTIERGWFHRGPPWKPGVPGPTERTTLWRRLD